MWVKDVDGDKSFKASSKLDVLHLWGPEGKGSSGVGWDWKPKVSSTLTCCTCGAGEEEEERVGGGKVVWVSVRMGTTPNLDVLCLGAQDERIVVRINGGRGLKSWGLKFLTCCTWGPRGRANAGVGMGLRVRT